MELAIEPYDSLPCELMTFIINGIEADEDDFGNSYDADSENAEEYGCGDHVFESKLPTQKVLDKYKISTDEYSKICDALTEKLHVGPCGWCI
jgi:hypothetical protein